MTENERRILTSLAMMCSQYHWNAWPLNNFQDVRNEMDEAAAEILAEYGLLEVRDRMVRWTPAGQNLVEEGYISQTIFRPKPRCMTETEKRIMIPLVMKCFHYFCEQEGKFYNNHLVSDKHSAETLDAFGVADDYSGYVLWTAMGWELIGQYCNTTERSSTLTL